MNTTTRAVPASVLELLTSLLREAEHSLQLALSEELQNFECITSMERTYAEGYRDAIHNVIADLTGEGVK
jgi:rRNA-processing protein FCF1